MGQIVEASIVEVLNPPWHIAALVVLDNSTVTMAGMLESFVKVELGDCCCN